MNLEPPTPAELAAQDADELQDDLFEQGAYDDSIEAAELLVLRCRLARTERQLAMLRQPSGWQRGFRW